MVHTSLGKMGYVCGGAQAVIEALMEVVGDSGTIMMPTQSWKNLDPETGVHWEADQKDWQLIRDNWPAYDKNLTPTNTMGAVAEMFRQVPGSVRSDHPARSVCAWGRYAEYPGKHICVEHSACQKRGKESGKPTKPCLWMAMILKKSERILRSVCGSWGPDWKCPCQADVSERACGFCGEMDGNKQGVKTCISQLRRSYSWRYIRKATPGL